MRTALLAMLLVVAFHASDSLGDTPAYTPTVSYIIELAEQGGDFEKAAKMYVKGLLEADGVWRLRYVGDDIRDLPPDNITDEQKDDLLQAMTEGISGCVVVDPEEMILHMRLAGKQGADTEQIAALFVMQHNDKACNW